MRWGWMSAGRQAAGAGGAGVVSARLPERLLSRSRSLSDCVVGRLGRKRRRRRRFRGARSRAELDGIGRDWSTPHSPVAARAGVVTYHPHRSETQAVHTYGTPSSARLVHGPLRLLRRYGRPCPAWEKRARRQIRSLTLRMGEKKPISTIRASNASASSAETMRSAPSA